ncbi:venom protease-like [Pectinophora gossypiella]|uniref:venom protease-like n=1 Tax=Pectinophora gossypiella TaxID=13191 RepID=UPI00214E1925|nr:venom protease-like [Pectinophora gossypiella]
MIAYFVPFFLLATSVVSQKSEGDSCIDGYTNSVGRCVRAESCQSAQTDFQQNGIRPTFCAYTFDSALVCCRDEGSILQTQTSRPAVDNDRPVWGNQPGTSGQSNNANRKRVSERKCSEYSRGVVEKVDFIPLLPDPETLSISASKCDYTRVELIVGGEKASLGEFPHMAAIGWSNDESYQFNCGGSLISPRFVLTAGHCIRDPRQQNPEPVVVRLADQNIDPTVDDRANPVDVPIKRIHKHPEYQPPKRYNDIALLELATDVDFEANIRPACLWTQPGFGAFDRGIATGWGVNDTRTKTTSKDLQKVSLSLLENDYCGTLLPTNRNWAGFRPTQLCAGELRGGKDTCQGDSGSPLQVASKDNQCIFYIIGITSFGGECARSGQPSIYTRVSSYLDWIEGVVWPGE